MDQTSNAGIIKDQGQYFKDLYDRDEFYNATTDNAMPPLCVFQKTHLASSNSNIIFNGIQSTPQRGWNAAVVNCGGKSFDILANAELHPGVIKTHVEDIDWTDNSSVAQQYALGILKEGVEKMYGGTLALRGNPKIEPYDRIYVSDKINRMHGWIEVETVIHKFDTNFGFTTHVTPNMVCAINSDAYKTDSQIIRSMISSDTTFKAIGSFLAGMAGGYVIGTAFSALTLATGGLFAVGLGVIATTTFFATAGYSIMHSIKAAGEVIKVANGRSGEVDIMEFLEAAHKDSLFASAFNHGLWYGFIAQYLAKTYNLGFTQAWTNTVDFKNATVSVFNNTASKLWKMNTALIPFESGRNGIYLKNMFEYYARLVEKMTGIKSTLNTKGLDTTSITELEAMKATLVKADQLQYADPNNPALTDEVKKANTTKAAKVLKSIDEAIARAEAIALKNGGTLPARPPQIMTPEAVEGLKPARNILGGLFKLTAYTAILELVNVFPDYLESYLINYATRANVITLSPLMLKNRMMMAGLDGFQKTNAFMHMKNMIINAKRVLDDLDRAVDYTLPTLGFNPLISTAEQLAIQKNEFTGNAKTAGSKNKLSTKTANEIIDLYGSTVQGLVGKYTGKNKKGNYYITCAAARQELTPERIMAIMYCESCGVADAGKNTTGRGVMQIVMKFHHRRFFDLDNINATNLKNVNMDIYNESSDSISILSNPLRERLSTLLKIHTSLNIECAIDYLVDIMNGQFKNDCTRKYPSEDLWTSVLKTYAEGDEWRGVAGTKLSEDENLRSRQLTKAENAQRYIDDAISNKAEVFAQLMTSRNIRVAQPATPSK
jgi:hypothetical protein